MAASSWPIYSAKLEFTAKYKLSVQFDTAIELHLTNETNRDEDEAFAKVPTLPTGILAVRVFGCVGLSSSDFKIEDDVVVYARVIAGALGKSTLHKPFAKGKPIWNECLFFPVQLTGNPKSTSNRLTILIIGRDEALDKKTGISNHKLLGKVEFSLYNLVKHRKTFETIDIMNRRQQSVGQLQLEMALLYGPFGFGQSHQLENHLLGPEEMVQVSFYPKVAPSNEGPQFRGVSVIPKKVAHPSFIPFNGKAKHLEPAISETYGKPLPASGLLRFPSLTASMKRLSGLQLGLLQQKSRTRRIAYLRGVLRDLDKVDLDDDKKLTNRDKLAEKSVVPSAGEDGTSVASSSKAVSEDEDNKDKTQSKSVAIPMFARSLDRLVETMSVSSSGRDSTASAIDAPSDYLKRRHRKSGAFAAWITSQEESG